MAPFKDQHRRVGPPVERGNEYRHERTSTAGPHWDDASVRVGISALTLRPPLKLNKINKFVQSTGIKTGAGRRRFHFRLTKLILRHPQAAERSFFSAIVGRRQRCFLRIQRHQGHERGRRMNGVRADISTRALLAHKGDIRAPSDEAVS